MTARFMGMLVNNTGTVLGTMIENAIRNAGVGPLPEEILDIFSVKLVKVDGEDRLIVDFLED